MTVRLKAPHGARNPHGFDQELWLWEHGLQAVGYVRNGWRDAPPERLADGRWGVDSLRKRCARPFMPRCKAPWRAWWWPW
jgi:competence protein ComEC